MNPKVIKGIIVTLNIVGGVAGIAASILGMKQQQFDIAEMVTKQLNSGN